MKHIAFISIIFNLCLIGSSFCDIVSYIPSSGLAWLLVSSCTYSLLNDLVPLFCLAKLILWVQFVIANFVKQALLFLAEGQFSWYKRCLLLSCIRCTLNFLFFWFCTFTSINWSLAWHCILSSWIIGIASHVRLWSGIHFCCHRSCCLITIHLYVPNIF